MVHSPRRASPGPRDLDPRASTSRARAVSRPRRAPAHERSGPASRGVIRGGARGWARSRRRPPLRRERGHVVAGHRRRLPSRPVLFLVGPAGSTSAGQRLREREREREGRRRIQGVGAGEPFCATGKKIMMMMMMIIKKPSTRSAFAFLQCSPQM